MSRVRSRTRASLRETICRGRSNQIPFSSFALTCAAACALCFVPNRTLGNVLGSDSQNFNSITNGLDFVTVHGSETLKPGIFNLGFFLNYAANTLPYRENNPDQGRTNFNDSLLGADLNLGVGLMKNWDIGISFPQILAQSVESDTGAHGQFAEYGLTEIRVNTKVRLLGDDSGGVAFIASVNFDQTDENPFTGTDAGPTFNLEAAVDKSFGDFSLGVNAGYRVREPGEPVFGIGITPYDDQLIGSVAASFYFRDYDTKLIGEIYGGLPAESVDSNTDREQTSLEALIGLKHDFNASLAGHVGGGTELIHGNASPDWRVYIGLNYTFGPLFSKQPDVRETFTTNEEEDFNNEDLEDPFAGTPTKPIETFTMHDVLFKFDSDQIDDDSKNTLDKLATYLMKPPAFKHLEISGHTDSIGSTAYNLSLSQRRALKVKRYLIEQNGLPSEKISAFGFGEGVPVADNGNYQGRALNRRVEFKITRDFNEEASKSPPPDKVRLDRNDPGHSRSRPLQRKAVQPRGKSKTLPNSKSTRRKH